jgi:hypothetical protein
MPLVIFDLVSSDAAPPWGFGAAGTLAMSNRYGYGCNAWHRCERDGAGCLVDLIYKAIAGRRAIGGEWSGGPAPSDACCDAHGFCDGACGGPPSMFREPCPQCDAPRGVPCVEGSDFDDEPCPFAAERRGR